jgi:hypothetical protein
MGMFKMKAHGRERPKSNLLQEPRSQLKFSICSTPKLTVPEISSELEAQNKQDYHEL